MKKAAVFLWPMAVAFALVAQDKPATPAPKPERAPPIITEGHRAEFFKHQLEAMRAQEQLNQAQQMLNTAIADMAKDCGEGFKPTLNQQGDPFCVAAPKQPATAAEPAKK